MNMYKILEETKINQSIRKQTEKPLWELTGSGNGSR